MTRKNRGRADDAGPDEPERQCLVCGREAGDCICPECPDCGAAGDPLCYKAHRLNPEMPQGRPAPVDPERFTIPGPSKSAGAPLLREKLWEAANLCHDLLGTTNGRTALYWHLVAVVEGHAGRRPPLDQEKVARILGADSSEPVEADVMTQYLRGKYRKEGP